MYSHREDSSVFPRLERGSSSVLQAPSLGPWWRLFLIFLVLCAGAEFSWRGPVRFVHSTALNDFTSPYIQSKALLKGLDPYSPENLVKLWPEGSPRFVFLEKELADGSLVAKRGIPTAYPLTCLLLLAPFAVLPWKAACAAWLALLLATVFMLAWSMIELGELGNWRRYLFVALVLALAPMQTGIAVGSIVIVAAGLIGVAVLSAHQRRDLLAGILLGLAACLKPQIGLPFIAYYLVRRRWKMFGDSITVMAVCAAIPMTRLAMSGASWFANYRNDNRILLTAGILGDFTERNPTRFGLINLQVLAYSLVKQVGAANLIAEAVTAALCMVWLYLLWRGRGSGNGLLEVSAIAVLSLLPVYHRMYDATLLVLPLGWSLSGRGRSGDRRFQWAALILLLVFLVPGGSMLQKFEVDGRIPSSVLLSWWWNMLVMPHQVWALLLLSGVLLCAMGRMSLMTAANSR